MSKRLADTEIWKKPWFFDLPDKYKLFWFYILSDCDQAGIWTANFKIIKVFIGEVDHEKILEFFKDQITVLNGGTYWFINDFIKFQYGYPVAETSKMRKKLDELLSVRNLNLDTLYDTVSIQYRYCIDTGKDKDKDKDKDKEGGVGETKQISPDEQKWISIINENYPKLFKMRDPLKYAQHTRLIEKYGKGEVTRVYERMQNWPDLIKKRESAYLTARNFLRTDNPNL